MKRLIVVALIVLAAVGAWAQTDLAQFQAGFQAFAEDMAKTLSYNATVGNNWSDAYIGQFPHFGAGVAVGATGVPVDSVEGLFTAMGITLPTEFQETGLPIPSAALAARIGGFVLPFDLGLKAMILPPEATGWLSSAGVGADYKLFGGNVRIGLVKEGTLFPDVSLGAGYNRLTGSMLKTLDVGTATFTYEDESATSHTLEVSDPDMALNWTTDSFDFTLQVSKKILFIRPFVGAGYSMGKSTVNGGMMAEMLYDSAPIDAATAESIKAELEAAGYDMSEFTTEGFMFAAEHADPVFRLYGGLSLELLFLALDLQAQYVPATKSFGANAMLRFQL
ncbi:MAG: hypothetical protein JW923_02225 [Spirochaetales bacterium]|nr:hypothetical protein [Spirochaetales bacterium]